MLHDSLKIRLDCIKNIFVLFGFLLLAMLKTGHISMKTVKLIEESFVKGFILNEHICRVIDVFTLMAEF